MKLCLLLVAVFGLSYGAVLPEPDASCTLEEGFNEILGLVPVNDIKVLVVKAYTEQDPEIVAIFEYLKSEDFHKLIKEIAANERVREFVVYINDAGIPLSEILKQIGDIIDFPWPTKFIGKTGGFRNLLDEIIELIPVEDIKKLYVAKYKDCAEFKELLEKLKGAHDLILKLKEIPEIQYIVIKLRELGVDIDKVVQIVKDLLGWL